MTLLDARENAYPEDRLMRVADVMRTSFATVKPSTPLVDAARLLLETNQRGLPVLDDAGYLIGIVAEGDFLHRDELGVTLPCNWIEAVLGIEEGGPVRDRMRALRIAAIMTPDPVCVDKDASIDEVVAEMDRRNIGQLPVVCADRVIGMVSRFELIAALERSLSRNEEKIV
jgi:CBS domain-containing protein